ncbi:putative lipid II flippase FtsW [Paeniglutamicibacter sp. Y32M11]|uniref:putative lipid II flippase FtsW n=1 Tax=Paeniglutamicibacter sp. Y32M11 TaxID=2853258 RepID=UPI00104F2676|nr:putative lipid II flippase FtsW [Paeniglutamicibacter sp. Y32M11]QXQ11549.1 putative lipid II flippase FtsW [Paeniglutamicibacter sp. Y32M11]
MSGTSRTPPGKGAKAGTPGRKPGRGSESRGLSKWFTRIEDPTLRGAQINYYVVLGTTLALTFMGLIMVLSSSSVEAIAKNKSAFGDFSKQSLWAVVGVICMMALQQVPVAKLKKLAWPALIIATALLMLVLIIGKEIYGNKNWIYIGPFSIQPSEFAKVALALWGAWVVERKAKLMDQWKHAVIPLLVPFGLLAVGLVLIGRDLGTALILLLILAVVMFVGGANARIFGIAGIAGLVGVVLMVILAPNRMGRILAWLHIACGDTNDYCYQAEQGLYALASGGWFGVGLGQSRQKWSHIPEAQNDFIFAVLGEELGLLGTIFVIVLYGMLAVAMYRIAVRAGTIFGRVAISGIMAWIIGQAFINIGMVTGLLPVIGLPLPFISSGGSALLATFLGVGVVLCFARDQRSRLQRPGTRNGLRALLAKSRGTTPTS